MRGFWADERIEGGIWNRSNPVYAFIYSYFKRKEKELLRNADQIVSLTEAAKNVISDWKVTEAPITVIPTCVDLRLFNPSTIGDAAKVAMRQSLNLRDDDFVVLYHGSWATWYMKDEMLDFFSVVKKIRPAARFVIATQDRVDLEGYQHKRDVSVFNCPRNQVPVVISIASVCVFFIRPSFSKTASMPTKLGELIAMDARVVTNKGIGDIENIMKTYSRGVLIGSFSETEYSTAINNSLADDGGPAGNDLKKFFSLDRGVELYNRIYQSAGER
jgi:glycosyltransferase involved in cell wall biosynthesis